MEQCKCLKKSSRRVMSSRPRRYLYRRYSPATKEVNAHIKGRTVHHAARSPVNRAPPTKCRSSLFDTCSLILLNSDQVTGPPGRGRQRAEVQTDLGLLAYTFPGEDRAERSGRRCAGPALGRLFRAGRGLPLVAFDFSSLFRPRGVPSGL